MHHYIPNCIPLCLNRIFRNLYRCAAHNTPTSNSENFKLQLGVIGMSDIEWAKRKDPLPYWIHSIFLKVEELNNSLSKSGRFQISGSTFLVPEHQIPIWLDFVLGFRGELVNANRSSMDTRTQTCLRNVLDNQNCSTCTRTDAILQTQRILLFMDSKTCTRTEPILQT